jgi:hypothetical protein
VVNIHYGYPQQQPIAFQTPPPTARPPRVEDPRERFLSDFRLQALKQAETTFRLSVWFMSAGAVILLAGGVLALMRHGASAAGAATLMTSLAGVLIGTCGGAFAVHANRARRHLTAQAEKIDSQLALKLERDAQRSDRDEQREVADRTFEKVVALIDRVDDPATKDRLKSMLAMQALQLAPEPNQAAGMVMPGGGSETKEITGHLDE